MPAAVAGYANLDTDDSIKAHKAILKVVMQVMNTVFFIFFLVFGIMVITEHTNENVATLQFGTKKTMDDSIAIVNIDEPSNSVSNCTSSDRNEFERCAMSKLPDGYTTLNSYLSIWPGRSMNKPFLLFILCMIQTFFAVALSGTYEAQHGLLVKLKAVVLIMLQLSTLIMISFYQYEWGVGYSSIFVGLTFTLIAISYTWSYVHWENSTNSDNQVTPLFLYGTPTTCSNSACVLHRVPWQMQWTGTSVCNTT